MASKRGWGSAVTYNGSIECDQPGALRTEFNSSARCFQTFKFVKTTSSVDIYNGVLVYGLGGGTIITTIRTAVTRGNPVGIAQNRIDSNSYGWVQVGGIHTSCLVGLAEETGTEGEVAIAGAAAGVLGTVALGTAPTYRPVGYFVGGLGSKAVLLTLIDTRGV